MPPDDATGRSGSPQPRPPALVLPGFVNAHSHAFQRCLRGRVEGKSLDHPDDDFWSWREAMYAAANAVDADDVSALAAWCYLDMVRAGVVAVGEFHYLHHPLHPAPGGTVGDPLALSRAVVDAAAAVGLHMTLLETAYQRAGPGRAATAGQRRFIFESVEAYLSHVEQARRALTGPLCNVGLAIHSVRACSRGWIEAIAAHARQHGLPLHIHACEQRREIAECRDEHGLTPIALLAACGALTTSTTLVHATHLDDDDIAAIAASGATVCLTPSTERNLGDGLCRIRDLHAVGVPLCVGSDSHARIDMVDELRSVEDHERLRLEKRCLLVKPGERLAQALVPIGTRNGARALGIAAAGSDGSDGSDDAGRIGAVVVPLPIEGRANGAAVGLDAWLVGGSSRDVGVVVGATGQVIHADDARFAARDAEIERRAIEVLQRLAS